MDHRMHTCIALLFLFTQLNLGDAAGSDIVHHHYRRDAEDKYYDPTNRDGCPPSLSSGGGGSGSGSSSGSNVAVILIVDFTLANKPDWKAQVDFLMKALSYLPGAKVGIVQLDCSSDWLFGMEVSSEDKVRKTILDTKTKSDTGKKGTHQAFNIAAQWLMGGLREEIRRSSDGGTGVGLISGKVQMIKTPVQDHREITEQAPDKKVIVLTDGEKENCVKEKPSVSELQIAQQWRNAQVQALVVHVANGNKSPKDMEKIASDADSVISVPNFQNIDKSVYKKMAKLLCE